MDFGAFNRFGSILKRPTANVNNMYDVVTIKESCYPLFNGVATAESWRTSKRLVD
jgi:hypothetical protein